MTQGQYVNQIPYGLGININPTVEKIAASGFVWRCFTQPEYWTDGGYGKRNEKGYIPTLPLCEWNDEAQAIGKTRRPQEFWLVGKDTQDITHPTDAANFSNEWMLSINGLTGLPGVRVSPEGMKWFDTYLEVGGLVPDAWHIHITAPLPTLLLHYDVFLQWMRARNVLRPVVVTDFSAGTDDRKPHKELAANMVSKGLLRLNFLSALIWSDVYTPQNWATTMLLYSMQPSLLGVAWLRSQKEWRDALTNHSTNPARTLLGR